MTNQIDVVAFDRSSPVLAYWLPNCEGFRVRAPGRRGVVDAVELRPDGEVDRLVVRFGIGRRTLVEPEAVEAVVPAEEVLVLDGALGHQRSPKPKPEPQRQARAAARRSADALATGFTAARRTARRRGGSAGGIAAASARGAWAATAACWRAAGRRKAGGLRWLEPRALTAGRSASLAVDGASIRLVASLDRLGRTGRAKGGTAARALAAAVGAGVVGARERFRHQPAEGEPASGEQPDADARERAA